MIEPHTVVLLVGGQRVFLPLEEYQQIIQRCDRYGRRVQAPNFYRSTDIFGNEVSFDTTNVMMVGEWTETGVIDYLKMASRMKDLYDQYGPKDHIEGEDWKRGF